MKINFPLSYIGSKYYDTSKQQQKKTFYWTIRCKECHVTMIIYFYVSKKKSICSLLISFSSAEAVRNMGNMGMESVWLLCVAFYVGSAFSQGVSDGSSRKFIDPNLPPSQYPFFFQSHPEMAEDCRLDESCPYKVILLSNICLELIDS